MKKLLSALLMWALCLPAYADVSLTSGSGVTMKTADVGGGVQSSLVILGSTAGAAIYGTAGTANANVLTIQGIASGTVVPVSLTSTTITGTVAATQSGTWNIGTVTTVTGVTTVSTVTSITNSVAVTHASGSVSSGAYASGSIASGAYSSGSIASGALASGSIAAGAMVDLLTMRQTVAAGTVAANSLLTGGQYNSTPITLTNTQGSALQLDANGYLKVNTAAGAAAGGTSSNFGSSFPTPGTAAGFSDGTNMIAAKVGAVANVAAATNMLNTLPSCNYNATPLTVTDTRYQSIQCDVNGFMKVNVTNANANGAATEANSSPVVGKLTPTGTSGSALTDVVCGSAVSSCVLKASAGNFYGVYAECSAACWLMVFNATSAPSNGSTTAGKGSGNLVDCVAIPAGDQRGVSYTVFPVAMSVGITAAISSTTCATLTLATTGFIHGTVQ